MRILIFGKWPPIQGGVSSQVFTCAKDLATLGHAIDVVTNAAEVERGFREVFLDSDHDFHRRWCAQAPSQGGIHVHYTSTKPVGSHIPFSNPYASKLLGLGLDVAAAAKPDLIVGWYLEPYGVVASVLSAQIKRPYVVAHAGSDIGRLAYHPQLSMLYRHVLNGASAVMSSGHAAVRARLLECGARPEQILTWWSDRLPSYYARPPTRSLNSMADYFDLGRTGYFDEWIGEPSFAKELFTGSFGDRCCADVPTLVSYGKISTYKGTFLLLSALNRIANDGAEFNLILLACGNSGTLSRLFIELAEYTALRRRTTILPALPPWRVPDLLAGADIGVELEHNFPISFHGSSRPREMLNRRVALLISEEMAKKQAFEPSMVHRQTCIRIADPSKNQELDSALSEVIQATDLRRRLAFQGKQLSTFYEAALPSLNSCAELIHRFGANAVEGSQI